MRVKLPKANYEFINSAKSVMAALLCIVTMTFAVSCSTDDGDKVINVAIVKLATTSAQIVEGQSMTLTATVLPVNATNNSVSWSSDTPTVASVDNSGKVTAVSVGKCVITATADGRSAKCDIEVMPNIISVISIVLDHSTLELTVSETATLTPTITPNNATDQTIKWASDNTAVATVDINGKVTAVKAGQASVTATTTDGGKQAVCAVTVKAAPIKTYVIAHRGYWRADGVASAQNSIASLAAAQAIGVYGSEFDVNMTSDNKLVVVHGPSTTGISDVRATTFDKVRAVTLSNGEPIPTLDEYLTQGAKNTNVKLILEIKSHATSARETEVVEAVLAEVSKHKMEDQVEYIAFSIHVCKEIVRLNPKAKVAYLNGTLSPADLYSLKVTGLDYQKSVMTNNSSWLSQARSLGLTVNVWTLNSSADIEWAVEQPVDYITTDYPTTAQDIIKAKANK